MKSQKTRKEQKDKGQEKKWKDLSTKMEMTELWIGTTNTSEQIRNTQRILNKTI